MADSHHFEKVINFAWWCTLTLWTLLTVLQNQIFKNPPFEQVLSSSWDGPRFGHNKHRPKIDGAVPLLGGGAGSLCSTLRPGPRPTFIPSGTLIHPAVWPPQIWAENWGTGAVPPFGGELGPHLVQCGLFRSLPPYQVASWSMQLFGHNRNGPKIGWGLCLLFGEGRAGSPSSTMWPDPCTRMGLCPFLGRGSSVPL